MQNYNKKRTVNAANMSDNYINILVVAASSLLVFTAMILLIISMMINV